MSVGCALGRDDRGGVGQRLCRLVVVEHDDVESVLVSRGGDLFERGDSAVGGDQYLCAFGGELSDGCVLQTITLAFPVGNEWPGVDAGPLAGLR